MAKAQKPRKKLLIDRNVQGALLRRLLLHWACAMAVGFTSLLIIQVFQTGVNAPLAVHLSQMWNTYGMLLVVLIFFIPPLAYDSIKLSSRFAGPMYAIRSSLVKLADGRDVTPLQFREDDFWVDVADSINTIAKRLDQEAPQAASSAANHDEAATVASTSSE